jgi:hypothetical protein
MSNNEFVFGSYTIKQVSMIESEYFVIRFDGDFFAEDGYMLFTMSQAKATYRNLVNDLSSVIKNGIQKDKEYALQLILGMVIEPVRYH